MNLAQTAQIMTQSEAPNAADAFAVTVAMPVGTIQVNVGTSLPAPDSGPIEVTAQPMHIYAMPFLGSFRQQN